MRIQRVKTVHGISHVTPYLQPPLGVSREEFAATLKRMLMDGGERVFAMIQYRWEKDKEEPEIRTFLFAFRLVDAPAVQLVQYWTSTGGPDEEVWDRFELWMENLGIEKVVYQVPAGASLLVPDGFVKQNEVFLMDLGKDRQNGSLDGRTVGSGSPGRSVRVEEEQGQHPDDGSEGDAGRTPGSAPPVSGPSNGSNAEGSSELDRA